MTFEPLYTSSKDAVANGDKIEITASYDQNKAIQEKKLITAETKTYIVSGLPEYLSKAKQLTAKSLKDIKSISDSVMQKYLTSYIPDFIDKLPNVDDDLKYISSDESSFKNTVLQKMYLYTTKKDTSSGEIPSTRNSISVISSVDILAKGKQVGTTYIMIKFNNAILNHNRITSSDNLNEATLGQYSTLEEAQRDAESMSDSSENIEPVDIKQISQKS